MNFLHKRAPRISLWPFYWHSSHRICYLVSEPTANLMQQIRKSSYEWVLSSDKRTTGLRALPFPNTLNFLILSSLRTQNLNLLVASTSHCYLHIWHHWEINAHISWVLQYQALQTILPFGKEILALFWYHIENLILKIYLSTQHFHMILRCSLTFWSQSTEL